MTNFALNTSSSPQSVIQSLNYALATAGGGNVLTVNTNGSIVYQTGQAYSYLYQYLWVAYSTSSTGQTGFSFSPTGATYYGLRSNSSSTESTNPADYTWTQVSGGFGTTNFLWYISYGGGQINFYIGSTAPNSQYKQVQDNVAINLYLVTATNGANGAPGSNGITSSVLPSIINFPQNSDGTYTANTQSMSASFFSNANSIAYANITATINSAGNVNITEVSIDPSISVTTLTSANTNSLTLDFIQNTGASVTGLVNVQVNGLNGNTGANGNSGVSTYSFTTYTLGNALPLTPKANTGSWNFSTSTGTPPIDPDYYIEPSTITLDTSNQSAFTHFANLNVDGYNFYTMYVNTYEFGPYNSPVTGYGGQTFFYDTFSITGNTAYVDILMVGSGGAGVVNETTGYLASPGGQGGNVILVSNVAMPVGTYSVAMGSRTDGNNQGVASLLLSGNIISSGGTLLYAVNGGLGGDSNPNGAGAGGGFNGNVGTLGQQFIAGNYGPYAGGTGVPDPWNQITWVGQISGNGLAYFGGGGGAGSPNSSPAGSGGEGGGGGGAPYGSVVNTKGTIGSGGGGGGGNATVNSSGFGGTGVIVMRQHLPNANEINTWSVDNLQVTPTQQVYSSTALASTTNANANVTQLYWSTPIVSTPIAAPSMSITYPQGQFVTYSNGVYTPTPQSGIVTLTANVQAIRSNTILAAVTQTTQYFTANGGYAISSNSATAYNANSFTISSPTTTTYNLYQNITYSDIGGNVTGFISEALLQGTQGNIGPQGNAGLIPLAYIISNVDPTTASNSLLSSIYASPRTNTLPPIGVGVPPVQGTTAQFFYPNINAYGSGVTSVKTYSSGNIWTSVNAQVISGATIYTGTVTAGQLWADDIYTLTLQSTNATVGNTQSAGFWLASDTGDAHFAGNTTIGNKLVVGNNAIIGTNLVIGNNLVVGNNAIIGGNLTIGNNSFIGQNLSIGNNLTIGNNAVTGGNLNIGNNSFIGQNLSVGDNAIVGNNAIIGNNAIVGNNAVIGGNLTVGGLISGSNLNANTVSGTNIQYNSITNNNIANNTISYNNLASSVTSLLPTNFGNVLSNNSYSLTSTSSYDYTVYSGASLIGYAKNLGISLFSPARAQALVDANFNVVYNFTITSASGIPSGVYMYLWLNSGEGGGYGNVQYQTTSTIYYIGPSGPDENTFNSGLGAAPSAEFGGTFTLTTGVNQFSYGNTSVIGLTLLNPTGAGNIQIRNFNWGVTYP